jgi:serine/threonine-protein kinase
MALAVPESTTNAPEQRKIGRYIVTGVLGRGAMGTVYRALDPLIERTVALKVLAIDMQTASDSGFRERFFREAKSAGSLNHPNIVTIHDVGECDGTPYIAMEFLPGLTLRESLDSGVVLPVRKIIDVGMLVARGVDYAHQNGVIHRDIKPANIMLARSGTVKIMDFGIAIASDTARTMPDAVLGSPRYMAPEQILNAPVDARTDVFALGVVLYEMLAGKDPFEGSTIPAVMHKVLHVTPPPPTSFNPDVPPALDAIVMRALAKNPQDRFQRAKDLGRALGALRRELKSVPARGPSLAAANDTAHTPQPPPQTPPPRTVVNAPPQDPEYPRTIRWGAILVAVAAVLMIATAVVRTGFRTPAAPPPQASAVITPANQAPALNSGLPSQATAYRPGFYLGLPDPGQDRATDDAILAEMNATRLEAAARAKAASKAASARTPATVQLSVLPWGEVRVNGKLRGVTPPLNEIDLPPGKHRIEIRNTDFPPYTVNVRLESGESHRIAHRFGQ